MTPWSIPPLVVACIMFYVFSYHMLIYVKRKEEPVNLSFAFLCLFIGLYDTATVFLYNISNPIDGALCNRWQMVSIAMAGSCFVWFVSLYTRQISKKVLVGFVSVLSVLALVQVFDRTNLTYQLAKPSIKQFHFWGMDIIHYETELGVITEFQLLVGYSVFLFSFLAVWRFYKSGKRRQALPLLAAIVIFFVGIVNDAAAFSGLYEFPYILEYAFFSMVYLMAHSLSNEVIEAALTKEALLKSQESLRQSQKLEAIGRLAGGISHDFNNLLVPILGYSELGMRHLTEGDQSYVKFQKIHEAAEQAKSISHQFLAFGREQMLSRKVVKLSVVVREMASVLEQLICESGRADLEFVLEPNSGSVEADPSRLRQILMNLVINASDATSDGGKISVEVSDLTVWDSDRANGEDIDPGDYVALSVRDNGHGMDQATIGLIFDPFFSVKKKTQGTGLGLATVYGIVRQHGGHIRVKSELGKGSVFQVLFHRVEGEQESILDNGDMASLSLRGDETILLVEDEKMVLDLAMEILVAQGYCVLPANNGEDALEIAKKMNGTIDLLITDVILPGIDGDQVHKKMLEIFPTIKVIHMSGHTGKVVLDKGLSENQVDFIQKPFSSYSLSSCVRRVLDS